MTVWLVAILFLVYLTVAIGVARLNAKMDALELKPDWWQLVNSLLMWLFLPANLCFLLIGCCLLTPYWRLYPERHAHIYDFEGTDEQREELRQWREEQKKKSFWQRINPKFAKPG